MFVRAGEGERVTAGQTTLTAHSSPVKKGHKMSIYTVDLLTTIMMGV